jgi:hypothetical protein
MDGWMQAYVWIKRENAQFTQDIQFPVPDLNPGSAKYERGILANTFYTADILLLCACKILAAKNKGQRPF